MSPSQPPWAVPVAKDLAEPLSGKPPSGMAPKGLTWALCHESGELSLSRLLARPPWPLELCRSFTDVLRGRHSCLPSALL